MARKILISLLIIAMIAAVTPVSAAADEPDKVLLVYNDKEQMAVISDLIKACGMEPVAVDSVEYKSDIINDYKYIVLQDASPLKDTLQAGKRPVCLGDGFMVIPGVQTEVIGRKTHADLRVYNNTQSVILEQGLTYIREHDGKAIGIIRFEGNDYPMGVITDNIMFAPYFSKDDISAFAVAQMLNEYFGKFDGGKMYVMIDEVYPFEDIAILQTMAEKFYNNGIPFIISVMPVYYNTDYPSFKRYANALKYIESLGGSLIMHDPLVTGNELVGQGLSVRLEEAFKSFEDNGVHIYEKTLFPYEVSLDMLPAVHPQNELFIDLPINTVIRFDMFKDEAAIDAAIETINNKWLQIGDYGRNYTDNVYLYEETEVDGDYVYKEKKESSYAFLVDAGNQILTVIVIISGIIIFLLIITGYRMYRRKFLKKKG